MSQITNKAIVVGMFPGAFADHTEGPAKPWRIFPSPGAGPIGAGKTEEEAWASVELLPTAGEASDDARLLDKIREVFGHGSDQELWPPGETLDEAVSRAVDDAIRFRLDRAGIEQRDADAVELVELRRRVRNQQKTLKALWAFCEANYGVREGDPLEPPAKWNLRVLCHNLFRHPIAGILWFFGFKEHGDSVHDAGKPAKEKP